MEHKHKLEQQIVTKSRDGKCVVFKFLRAIELSGFFESLVEKEEESRGDIEIDLVQFDSDDLQFVAEFVNSDMPNKKSTYEGELVWTWGRRFDEYMDKWDLPLNDLTYKITWSRRLVLANFLQMDMLSAACANRMARLLKPVQLPDRWKDNKNPLIQSERVCRVNSEDSESSNAESDDDEMEVE